MERAPTWTPIAVIGQGVRRAGAHLYEVSTPAALLASLRSGDPVLQPSPQGTDDPEEWGRVSFDALEDAGLPLERARTRMVGIYAGAVSQPSQLARHVSAELLLRGPTEGVEDSSLMAVYLACQGLSDGACELAMVLGGGEGERAVVVLERLDRALSERQPVLAVLRATGPLGQGLLSPTALKRVLLASSTDPADVGYVEMVGPLDGAAAHGALYGRVQSGPYFAQSQSDGVMALMRAVLSVRHREIFCVASSAAPLDGLGLRTIQQRTSWPLTRRAIAALTAYNGRGSPVHIIVAQADPDLPPSSLSDPPSVWMLPVSAHDPDALQLRAQDLVARLEQGLNLMDMAYTCCHHRSHLQVRAAVISVDMAGVRAGLAAMAEGTTHLTLVAEPRVLGKTAWLMSDAPAGCAGAGGELWRDEPAFRDAYDEACRLLSSHGCQLRGEVFRAESLEPAVALPARFALQVGLVAWLRSLGHEPDAIIGHETGEIAAGWACGSWSLSDAAGLVAERAKGGPPSWRTRARRAPAIPCWSAPSASTPGSEQRLREVLQEAASLGVSTVVELGADPTGTDLAREIYGKVVQMLAPRVSELVSVRRAVAELYVRGAPLDWARLVRVGTRAPLGAYPWAGRRRQARRAAPAPGDDPEPPSTEIREGSPLDLLRHSVALGLRALRGRSHRLVRAELSLSHGAQPGPLSLRAQLASASDVRVSARDSAGEQRAELSLSYVPAATPVLGASPPLELARTEAVGEKGLRLVLPAPFAPALVPGDPVPMSLEGYALRVAQQTPQDLERLLLEIVRPVPAGAEVLLVAERHEQSCHVHLSTRDGLVGTAIFSFRSP